MSLFKHLNWGVLCGPDHPNMTLYPIRDHPDVPDEHRTIVHALEFGTLWLRPAHIITDWTAAQLAPPSTAAPNPHPYLSTPRTFTLTTPETGAFRPSLNRRLCRVDIRVEVL